MILKWIFDRVVSLLGLLILWPVLLVVAILVKIKMREVLRSLYRSVWGEMGSCSTVISSEQ